MTYDTPSPESPIDQGDLIEGCPVVEVARFDPSDPGKSAVQSNVVRVVVLTQTCDLANQKTDVAVVAPVIDAQFVIERGILKPADIRGPVRGGKIWGWYFLPAAADLGLPEMMIDFRRVYTTRLDLLRELCRSGHRRGRVRPLYREHLAKHFADTYSRIGLPQPYETM